MDDCIATNASEQADEDVLTFAVSDEDLEAAAGPGKGAQWSAFQTVVAPSCACC
jgi:hypothetical protein